MDIPCVSHQARLGSSVVVNIGGLFCFALHLLGLLAAFCLQFSTSGWTLSFAGQR